MSVVLFAFAVVLLVAAGVLPRADSGLVIRKPTPSTSEEKQKLNVTDWFRRVLDRAPKKRTAPPPEPAGVTDPVRPVRRRRPSRRNRVSDAGSASTSTASTASELQTDSRESQAPEEPAAAIRPNVDVLGDTALLEPLVEPMVVETQPAVAAEAEGAAQGTDPTPIEDLPKLDVAAPANGPSAPAEVAENPTAAPWWVAVVGELAEPPSEDERVRIVSVLGTLGQPWCSATLETALQTEEDVRVRNAIAAVLAHEVV